MITTSAPWRPVSGVEGETSFKEGKSNQTSESQMYFSPPNVFFTNIPLDHPVFCFLA